MRGSHCCRDVKLYSEAAASNYKHESTNEDLPRKFRTIRRVVKDLVAAASSTSFSASVEAGLSIIDVPHVTFGNWVDSSLATLTVTSLGHVTEVLSPAFDTSTLFYEVNVTALRTQWTPVPVAKWLQAIVDGKAAPAIYTVHSTAPAYQNNRVIVSARDATTTTYVAHAFFHKFRVIVTLVPVMLSTHLCV